MVNIIQDVNLMDELDKYDVILVGTNCYNNLANGFQHEVSIYHPQVYWENQDRYGDVKKMGTVRKCTKKDNEPQFVLLFISKGYNFRPDLEAEFLSYEALENCLKLVNALFKGKNIGTTFIGTSRFDGKGNKEKVLEIIKNTLTDCDITLYDYWQETVNEKRARILKEEDKIKEIDFDKYYQAVRERKAKMKALKEFNKFSGI